MADMGDLATFFDRLNAASDNFIAGKAKDEAVIIARAILTDLVYHTPTDTGTALSNWQVTLDTPAESQIGAFAPSPAGRKVHGVWEHRVDPLVTIQANAPAVIEAANFDTLFRSKAPGQPIFITNNTDYIQELNNGSSTQAPAGFVERAEIIGQQAITTDFSVSSLI